MSLFGKKPPTAAPQTTAARHLPPDFIARNFLAMFKEAYARPRPTGAPGIHVETLVTALGAMAGFGCQMAVREAIVGLGLMPLNQALLEVKTKDGGTYYVGDQLNQPLLEARPANVWSLVGGGVQKLGRPLPDITDIVKFVIASMGTPNFGTIRVAPEHQPHQTPLEALKLQWGGAHRLLKSQAYDPVFTGWYFAHAIQMLIIEAQDVLDPTVAGQIAMESAVAMAKIDPRVIGFAL